MTEAKVGFLSKLAAAIISRTDNNEVNNKLKSYYLMRCKEITKGYGLPDKYFSTKIRCPTCCSDWMKNTITNVRAVKLSKRQRKRLKSRRVTESMKEHVKLRKNLLTSNELEKICTFCRHSYSTPIPKPQKQKALLSIGEPTKEKEQDIKEAPKILQKQSTKKPGVKRKEINVYASALDIFSMQNKNNQLETKEKPKVINNNKRKKDKFAGLCQQAVLASAKLKEQKNKQNKLNLFLKPSSTQ